MGPVEQGMNGPIPVSWQEINAWKEATGVNATREELIILRNLSSEYVAQYNRSEDPAEPPPVHARNVDHEVVAQQIESVFDRIEKARQ